MTKFDDFSSFELETLYASLVIEEKGEYTLIIDHSKAKELERKSEVFSDDKKALSANEIINRLIHKIDPGTGTVSTGTMTVSSSEDQEYLYFRISAKAGNDARKIIDEYFERVKLGYKLKANFGEQESDPAYQVENDVNTIMVVDVPSSTSTQEGGRSYIQELLDKLLHRNDKDPTRDR